MLVGSRLDNEGRARSPQPLRVDADYPAISVTNDGNALLFWLEGDRQDLFRGELTQSGLTLVIRLAAAPWPHSTADQLIHLDTGLDATHTYVFWQVRSASGASEVWTTSGILRTSSMRSARRLRVFAGEDVAQTGFNHGIAFRAESSEAGANAIWASPAPGQNETLPTAVFMDGMLGVVYFRNGEVAAYQTLGTLARGLIAPPRITADDDRDLAFAWWLPDTHQEAVLYFIASRR